MIITDLISFIRDKYNATGDTFFTDNFIINLLYQASMEMAVKAKIIEAVYQTSTVASQREYDYPANTWAIKRVEYNGMKLNPINMKEDDALTLFNSSTTEVGNPQYYFIWEKVIFLRPTPQGVGTLKIFSINYPQPLTASSVLEIPEEWHLALSDFVVAHMYAKDKDRGTFDYYMGLWNQSILEAKRYWMNRKRADSYANVMNEETLPQSIIRTI